MHRIHPAYLADQVYKIKFIDTPDVFCADGTIYFIEARIEDEHHLVGRHSCDYGFNTIIGAANELFDISQNTFPMLEEQLREIELSILNNNI